MQTGILYLIPNSVNNKPISSEWFYTDTLKDLLISLKYFVLETPKIGRQSLKDIEGLKVYEKFFVKIDENSKDNEIQEIINLLKEGNDIGLLSDSGIPCLADMGTKIVLTAHMNSIEVKSYGSTSSIIDTLIRSGLNGQRFKFNGYLNKIPEKRILEIKRIEKESFKTHSSQIFIETPYRSQYMFNDLLKYLNNNTYLTVGVDVLSDTEILKTKKVFQWKKELLQINNRKVVFIIEAK